MNYWLDEMIQEYPGYDDARGYLIYAKGIGCYLILGEGMGAGVWKMQRENERFLRLVQLKAETHEFEQRSNIDVRYPSKLSPLSKVDNSGGPIAITLLLLGRQIQDDKKVE